MSYFDEMDFNFMQDRQLFVSFLKNDYICIRKLYKPYKQ